MVNKNLVSFFVRNRAVTEHLYNEYAGILRDEEEKLRITAEQALLDPSLRDSAVLQLGRVTLLREVVYDLANVLGEQNNGRNRI